MHTQDINNPTEVQSKVEAAKRLCTEFLTPNPKVNEICQEIGHQFRDSDYNPAVVVWLFITQVLSKDHGCQQAVTRFNNWRIANSMTRVDDDTGAYCKARSRLPEVLFEKLLAWTAETIDAATDRTWLFHDRVVEMVDGWTVTMADTATNQKEYPQIANQKPGCGFPIARMIGVFSLATGAINHLALSAYQGKQTGETSLLRSILDRILPGRILLADRYYATFWLLAASEMRGIDLVARVHHKRKVDFRRGLRQGHLDQLVVYQKPHRPYWMSQEEYDQFPSSIFVRHLKYKIEQKGFRVREITLATTLLDAEVYTAEELAELYHRRWLVELHIRSLKTQMQMDHLRCKKTSSIRKEIHAHMIGYNLVRSAILAASLRFDRCPSKLSFTGAMQSLEDYGNYLRLGSGEPDKQWSSMLKTISELSVGNRPGRSEPRELKRRPKQYKLMQQPRDPNRNLYATAA
ncbi:IS4 family transposase [Rhodopirellula islandica]|uniref:IS4 family transposase n=1 Tax=Rhodopirellula islandica TaxID=595434 RepID=UPI000AB969EE|nr:IS4 family transposase [Rhodopirellula islandica]